MKKSQKGWVIWNDQVEVVTVTAIGDRNALGCKWETEPLNHYRPSSILFETFLATPEDVQREVLKRIKKLVTSLPKVEEVK